MFKRCVTMVIATAYLGLSACGGDDKSTGKTASNTAPASSKKVHQMIVSATKLTLDFSSTSYDLRFDCKPKAPRGYPPKVKAVDPAVVQVGMPVERNAGEYKVKLQALYAGIGKSTTVHVTCYTTEAVGTNSAFRGYSKVPVSVSVTRTETGSGTKAESSQTIEVSPYRFDVNQTTAKKATVTVSTSYVMASSTETVSSFIASGGTGANPTIASANRARSGSKTTKDFTVSDKGKQGEGLAVIGFDKVEIGIPLVVKP